MTKQELIALCENFKPGDKQAFQRIIGEFCKLTSDNTEILCTEFSIALTTAKRWENGFSRPHPILQPLIISFIKEKLKQ